MHEKTRQPRIYLHRGCVDLLSSDDFWMVANVNHEPRNALDIAFEPAVPKCATCGRYSGPGKTGRYGWCKVGPNEERTVPRDGSGYCHEHSELRHG